MKKRLLVDIHNHIIPRVDDGSRDLEITSDIIESAYSNGIRAIIATPHYMPQKSATYDDKLKKGYIRTKKAMKILHPDMKLFIGNEILYFPSVIEDLKRRKARTLAGSRYVLIEFAIDTRYEVILAAVKQLTYERYSPILAHLERYTGIRDNDDVIELIENGAYIQVNCNSVSGSIFSNDTKKVRSWIKNKLVHFIATDSHNNTTRCCDTKKSIAWIVHNVPTEYSDKILGENQIKVLKNEFI